MFCKKCGNRALLQSLNSLAIASIILIIIGLILYAVFQLIIPPNRGNNWHRFIGGFSWLDIYHIFLFLGMIFAQISLYKQKSKITLIFGIIPGAVLIIDILLWVLRLI